MLYALLIAGCALKEEPPSDTLPPVTQDAVEPCEETGKVETPLTWTEPSASGVSADDVFGFAVGPHTATLSWDDETTTEVTLDVTPGSAVETTVGPAETCPVGLSALAGWTISTADGRLDVSGDATWSTSDARADQPPGGVVVNATLDPAAVGVERLNPGSSMWLRTFLDGDGTLVSVVVEEMWPLATDRNRVCVRGSIDPTALACRDTGESTGPD